MCDINSAAETSSAEMSNSAQSVIPMNIELASAPVFTPSLMTIFLTRQYGRHGQQRLSSEHVSFIRIPFFPSAGLIVSVHSSSISHSHVQQIPLLMIPKLLPPFLFYTGNLNGP